MHELESGGTPTLYKTEPEDFAAYSLTGLPGERFATANELIRTVLGERQAGKELEEMKTACARELPGTTNGWQERKQSSRRSSRRRNRQITSGT